MSAEPHTSFGNMDAVDFIEEAKEDRVAAIENAFEVINHLEPHAYIEAADARVALAAAELVAAAGGRASLDLPPAAVEVVRFVRDPSALRGNASSAVRRVLANSELREIWGDTPDFNAWEAGVRDLLERLK